MITIIDLDSEPDTIQDHHQIPDENTIESVDLNPAFSWPRRMLRLINIWHEQQPETPYKKYIEFVQTCAYHVVKIILVNLMLNNTVDYIANLTNKSISSTLQFTQVIRPVNMLCQLKLMDNKKEQVDKLINETFSEITVPIHLSPQFQSLKHKCAAPNYKSLFQFSLLLLALIFPFVAIHHLRTYFTYENNQIKIKEPTLFLVEYFDKYPIIANILYATGLASTVPVFLLTFGFNLLYIRLGSVSALVFEHTIDVVASLEMEHLTQKQVKDTLDYVLQITDRANKFVTGINELYSTLQLLDFLTTVYLIYTHGILGISQMVYDLNVKNAILMLRACVATLFLGCTCSLAGDINNMSGDGIRDELNQVPIWTWNRSNRYIADLIVENSLVSLHLMAGPLIPMSRKILFVLLVLGILRSAALFLNELHFK